MSTNSVLEGRLVTLHRQRGELINRRRDLGREIDRIEDAIKKINEIIDSMSDVVCKYNNLDIANNRNWQGSVQVKAQQAHEQSGEGAKAYQRVLYTWWGELVNSKADSSSALASLEWDLQNLDWRISRTNEELSRVRN